MASNKVVKHIDKLVDKLVDKDKDKLVDKDKSTIKKTNIERFLSIASKLHINRKLNASSQYKYAYVLLDTDNKDPNLSTTNTFGWNVINFVALKTGTVSVIGKLRDIIGMRVYPITATFNAPIPAAGKIWVNNVVNLNYNFTILINELQSQSYIGRENRKFHFVFFPFIMNFGYDAYHHPFVPQNPYIEYITSSRGNGWVWFKIPFTTISTMTVSVGDPFDLLTQPTNQRMLIPIQLVYLSELDDN
jgi:hypothetical protein